MLLLYYFLVLSGRNLIIVSIIHFLFNFSAFIIFHHISWQIEGLSKVIVFLYDYLFNTILLGTIIFIGTLFLYKKFKLHHTKNTLQYKFYEIADLKKNLVINLATLRVILIIVIVLVHYFDIELSLS